MKPKIALCLSGQLRNWDLLRPCFLYLKNYYKDIDLKIFGSTWTDETYSISDDKELFDLSEELDFNSIAQYPRFSENNEKYTYLLFKSHLLRNKYEVENNYTFDKVIWTRLDCLVKTDMIDNVLNSRLTRDRTIYHQSQIDARLEGPAYFYSLNDNICFGTPHSMDTYSNMFLYFYCNKNINMYPCAHAVNPYFMIANSLLAHSYPILYTIVRERHRGLMKKDIKDMGMETFMSTYKKYKFDDEPIPE